MGVVAPGDSVAAVAEAIRSGGGRVLPVAGATKPALSASAEADVLALDLSGLSGVLEYDPGELTLTAHAGTPLAEIAALLAEHGQHLPADPVLAGTGSTLGGAVAAGTSGPGAYRHGGLRDFIIGVEFIDGHGRLVRAGGRVVKNAAGFDLSKLMVGSLGRLGVLTSVSVKVFPRAAATRTLVFEPAPAESLVAAMAALGRGPITPEAVDCDPAGRLLVRCAGAEAALEAQVRRCVAEVAGLDGGGVGGHRALEAEEADALWRGVLEFSWAGEETEIVRVVLSLDRCVALVQALSRVGAGVHVGIGGSVAWVAWPVAAGPVAALDGLLSELGLSGVRLTGAPGAVLVGVRSGGAFAERVRHGLDPGGRFLEL